MGETEEVSLMEEAQAREFHFSARDGLRLFAREYGPRDSRLTPVICLAGLTRNSRDFTDLAIALSTAETRERHVVCLDSRGRGRSQWDRNSSHYSLLHEALDVLDLIVAIGMKHVAIIGTSRGGLLAMAIGAIRPGILSGVVLNDIGPVIETRGLARIKSYVGKLPALSSWREASRLLKELDQHSFPNLSDLEWEKRARASFIEAGGRIVPDYDPALSKIFDPIDIAEGIAPIWPQFESLSQIGLLALRGENSDVLSADTLVEMQARAPGMRTLTVPDQGHAPMLADEATQKQISNFLNGLDRAA